MTTADQGVVGTLPQRPLAATGRSLSVIGFGGIVVAGNSATEASAIVSEAIDRGVNYFDVAPSYGDAESVLGPALQPYRKKVFLACKTEKRDAKAAAEHLDKSLENLKTDYLDLYQLHALQDVENDVKAAFAPGGAMDVILRARESGKIRYLGFSAHTREAAIFALNEFPFDTILYPVNQACHHISQFDQAPLDLARAKGVAILALKSMAKAPWGNPHQVVAREEYPKCWYEPIVDRDAALRALRFTLAQPGVTAAIPPGDPRLFRMALDLAAQAVDGSLDDDQAFSAEKEVPIFA